jgi:amino acid transporter
MAYGELGAMNPAAGGLYVYLRDAFGPLTAFLYGWTFFLVIATGSAATLAVASTSYLQQFVALDRQRLVARNWTLRDAIGERRPIERGGCFRQDGAYGLVRNRRLGSGAKA